MAPARDQIETPVCQSASQLQRINRCEVSDPQWEPEGRAVRADGIAVMPQARTIKTETGDLVRLSGRFCCMAALLAFGVTLAPAQSGVDAMVGFGSAWDKSNNSGIDSASGNACVPNSGDITCQTTSSMSSFFLSFGGDVMLYKHFGVGGEFSLQPALKNYGPLEDRQMFYDFNGIYQPYTSKRVALELQGGIGGARTSLSYNQGACVGNITCSNSVVPIGSVNHFQVHAGAGVKFFITEHLFIKPQFDYRYVPGLTDEFNSNSVPSATVWVGYNLGGR